MKFQVLAAAGLVAAANAASNGTFTTTQVVTAYTTYCPEPTKITQGNVTYTVTKPTTLTITNCPCTITKVHTTGFKNSTVPVVPTTTPAGNTPVNPTKPPTVTAAAAKVGSGLGLVAGIAALVL
ncbi:uncharacterized protein E0L32_008083 [Thyridium curvatum]|uniref:Clock-controlled protein 6 n=1 Tax=Thyridium curvatum TaxID=1093900 RepID=A0A507ATT1_9PEZI|nr:uncharacterized protein E0L32_008083 [Thyridium curvatum]TPX10877.1 hypothetical protein E0L32_008083 [Thyridium curvatum]